MVVNAVPKIHENIASIIGNTPLLRVRPEGEDIEPSTRVLFKLESENPGKSVKDRLALAMIDYLEKERGIQPGVHTLVEATSGNTGISLAMIGASKGYKVVLVMPDSMSMERRLMLRIYGAELILTPKAKSVAGAIEKVKQLVASDPTYVHTDQFVTEANARIHYQTTGPEIWRDTDGEVDLVVAGIGTGGTISGAGKFLKEQNPALQVVGVEPEESNVLNGGKMGPHMIMGIGAGFIPEVVDTELLDKVVMVHSNCALQRSQEMPRKHGLAVGISSGAVIEATYRMAKENPGKTVVGILASHAERYLSTALFKEIKAECEAMPTTDVVMP